MPSNQVVPSTSRSSVIRRSLESPNLEEVVVFVPNLEYAALANPPTCNVLPVRRYEAEAVPWNSPRPWTVRRDVGVVGPMPTLPLESMVNLSEPRVEKPRALIALLNMPVSWSMAKEKEGEAAVPGWA